jgi:hypothetical protein
MLVFRFARHLSNVQVVPSRNRADESDERVKHGRSHRLSEMSEVEIGKPPLELLGWNNYSGCDNVPALGSTRRRFH